MRTTFAAAEQTKANTTIFVGGIPGNISAQEIRSYFYQFGEVKAVKIAFSKSLPAINNGYCFVKFNSTASVKALLEVKEHRIVNRRVTCKPYLEGGFLNSEMNSQNSRKVIAKFIPGWMTDEDLKRYFESYGEVESYYMSKYRDSLSKEMIQPTSVGYIVFRDQNVANYVSEKKYFKVGKKKIHIEKYDPAMQRLGKQASRKEAPKVEEPASTNGCEEHYKKPTELGYKRMRSNVFKDLHSEIEGMYRFNLCSSSAASLRARSGPVESKLLQSYPYARLRLHAHADSLPEAIPSILIPDQSYSIGLLDHAQEIRPFHHLQHHNECRLSFQRYPPSDRTESYLHQGYRIADTFGRTQSTSENPELESRNLTSILD